MTRLDVNNEWTMKRFLRVCCGREAIKDQREPIRQHSVTILSPQICFYYFSSLAHLKVAPREPWHEGVDEEAQVRAYERGLVVAEIIHQVLGQLRLHADVGLAHLQNETVQVGWLCVCHFVFVRFFSASS